MKKLFLLSLTMLLASFSAFAERDFAYDESQYNAHAVVYAVLADANGVAQNYYVDAYAFIGDECRGKATYVTDNSGQTTYTFRIGVSEADAGKTVNFVLRLGNGSAFEYTLKETVTVSGTDETVGGIPSAPMKLTYIPIKNVSGPTLRLMYPGDTWDLTNMFVILPENATLPDELQFDAGNYAEYLQIDGNIVTALKSSSPDQLRMPVVFNYATVGADGYPVMDSGTYYIQVYTLVESIEWYKPGEEPKIRIPIGKEFDLDYILSFLTINPSTATEIPEFATSPIQDCLSITYDSQGKTIYKGTAPCKARLGVVTKNVTFLFVFELYQPVTALNQVTNQLYLPVGTKVNDMLPYTFTVEPSDASDPMAGIEYTILNGDGQVLQQAADGTINVMGLGHGQIQIQHSDIPNSPLIVNIEGFQEPTTADFSFGTNPLSVTLTQDQLSTLNIYETLRDNFIAPLWEQEIKLPDGSSPFYLYEDGDAGILYIDLKMNEAKASKYGSTKVGLKYNYFKSVLNGTTISNESKEFSITYDLNIVQGLSSISINPLEIGLEDTDALITITTEPAGIILDDNQIQFVIPDGADGKPAMNVQRIAGTNQWRVSPQSLVYNEYTATYGNMVANYERLSISQRILLKSGWSWIATYANTQNASSGNINDVFANVQEIRTQDRLYYNDPKVGWFTETPNLAYNEAVKLQVKDNESLNILCDGMSDYTGDAVQKNLRSNWNWFAFPYCYDHSFKEVFDGRYAVKLPDNSRIVSKDDGFVTYVEGTWQGNLETLRAGQAYMVFYADPYNGTQITLAPETALGRVNYTTGMPARNSYVDNNWEYNAGEYADNMTIIASVAQDLEEGRYSVGTYVNGECRGKGEMVGSRFFITAHGLAGEKVDFVIYDKVTGKFYEVSNSLTFGETAGTFNAPVAFNAPDLSGINDIDAESGIIVTIEGGNIVVKGGEADNVEVYNLAGQRVPAEGIAAGTYIVRVTTGQGVITKKIVKK